LPPDRSAPRGRNARRSVRGASPDALIALDRGASGPAPLQQGTDATSIASVRIRGTAPGETVAGNAGAVAGDASRRADRHVPCGSGRSRRRPTWQARSRWRPAAVDALLPWWRAPHRPHGTIPERGLRPGVALRDRQLEQELNLRLTVSGPLLYQAELSKWTDRIRTGDLRMRCSSRLSYRPRATPSFRSTAYAATASRRTGRDSRARTAVDRRLALRIAAISVAAIPRRRGATCGSDVSREAFPLQLQAMPLRFIAKASRLTPLPQSRNHSHVSLRDSLPPPVPKHPGTALMRCIARTPPAERRARSCCTTAARHRPCPRA
jgi:hypothetical protein